MFQQKLDGLDLQQGKYVLLIWLRLPFQALLVAWAWWFTRDNRLNTSAEAEKKT
ncbi:MAG TPA: hypothetical protein V6D35_15370 [Candidatus Sericytochromatia bacterium]